MITGILLALVRVTLASDIYVERTTAEGRVRGTLLQVLGRGVEQYRGIPFAEPPVDELRFRPPRPKEPWAGTLDATASAPLTACPQGSRRNLPEIEISGSYSLEKGTGSCGLITHIFTGSRAGLNMAGISYTDDCLRLNVWVPARRMPPGSSRPVLVWIHGGGYSFGSASQENYSGATIAAMADVLVVSMNYRLGVLGFMSVGSPEAPGNVGLLDQLQALQWVQRNIRSFGGDPERVTLFGESSGGASAHAHVLSPMSKGLFRRAVLMSGSMCSIDVLDTVYESMAKGEKLADIVGCLKGGSLNFSSNATEIIGCLRSKPLDNLISAASKSTIPQVSSFFPTYGDSFMPQMPLTSVSRGLFGATDILVGVTSDEAASAFLSYAKPELLVEDLEASEGLADTFSATVSMWLKVAAPDIELKYAADASKNDGPALRRQYIDYVSDRMFNCPMRFLAEKHSDRGSNVFVYVFSHKSTTAPYPSWVGAPHTSELPYSFGHVYSQQPGSPDGVMSEAFVRVLATFAESGVPEMPNGKEWPTYSRHSPAVIVMNQGQFNETRGYRDSQCQRFKSLFEQYK